MLRALGREDGVPWCAYLCLRVFLYAVEACVAVQVFQETIRIGLDLDLPAISSK